MKHDDLADVKPLGVQIQISDGVHGMWMGRQLCEVRGYSAPWTNDKILDYFKIYASFMMLGRSPFRMLLCLMWCPNCKRWI